MCTGVMEECLSYCLIIFQGLYVAVKTPLLCSREHNEMLRGNIERSMHESQSYFKLWWGWLSARRKNGGCSGCSNPVEDVSTYKGCERCQPPCCQLARWVVHSERLSCTTHRASWAPQSQWARNHLGCCLDLPTHVWHTFFFTMYCKGELRVRQLHVQRMELLLPSFVCSSHELQFSAHHQPTSLFFFFPHSLHQTDALTVSEIQKKKPHLSTAPAHHPIPTSHREMK